MNKTAVIEPPKAPAAYTDDIAFDVPNNRRYKVKENGVWCSKDNKPFLWLCHRLDVMAKTSTEDGHCWGRWLVWRGHNNVWISCIMRMTFLHSHGSLQKFFTHSGLGVSRKRGVGELLTDYIQSYPANRCLRIDNLGWDKMPCIFPVCVTSDGLEKITIKYADIPIPALTGGE